MADNSNYYRRVLNRLSSWGWGANTSAYSGAWGRTAAKLSRVSTPQGVIVHHTASAVTPTQYIVHPVGRLQLVVLANFHVRDGRIIFTAAGSSSHAGNVNKAAHNQIVEGRAPYDGEIKPGRDNILPTFSSNRYTVGIEANGAGGASEWSPLQKRAVVALCAALVVEGGLTAQKVGTHKELTRRKPGDPYMNAGELRRAVRDFIANPQRPDGSPVRSGNTSAKPVPTTGGMIAVDGQFGPASWAALDAINASRYKASGDRVTRMQRVLNYKSAKRGWRTRIATDGKLGPKTYGLWGALVGLSGVKTLSDELARRTQQQINSKEW